MNNELIEIDINKKPYLKKITEDKIINLTGESGSGKSYYSLKYKKNGNYIIIDTDEIFARYETSTGINKDLGTYFRNKYSILPSLFDDFDLIYNEILNYLNQSQKTIIIDSAQFRNMKNLNNLKGTVIVIRTCIKTCYERCINRFNQKNPTATLTEKEIYAIKKKNIFVWYKSLNKFIEKVDNL